MQHNNSPSYAIQESTLKTTHFSATCLSDPKSFPMNQTSETNSDRNQVPQPEVPERNTHAHITLQDYNPEQLRIDQLKCPELGPAIKFITNGANADLRLQIP